MREKKNVVTLAAIFILAEILIMSVQSVTSLMPTQQNLTVKLGGDGEIPSVKTKGTGMAYFQLNNGSIKYTINVTDIKNVTLAYLYRGAIGNNGPIVVTLFNGSSPTGEMRGILSRGNITNNMLKGPLEGISDLTNLIKNGSIYVNVHTLKFPNGEIRGELTNLTRAIK